MPNVQLTTIPITNSGTAQTIAVDDDNRKYIAIIATKGDPTISIGDIEHADGAFTLGEGNMLELVVNCVSKIKTSNDTTELKILQDIDSKCVLTIGGSVLTSDGETMAYNRGRRAYM